MVIASLYSDSRSNKSQDRVSQPVQQETSPSDSDICSECSTSDSDIPDEEQAGNSTSAPADAITAHNDSCARRQPTLVQHAAAATIQRRFRQHMHSTRPDCMRNMQCFQDQVTSSVSHRTEFVLEADSVTQQHEAASYIQAWWRRCSSKTLHLTAPLTPTCSSSNMQTSCGSMHNSSLDSASNSSHSGV